MQNKKIKTKTKNKEDVVTALSKLTLELKDFESQRYFKVLSDKSKLFRYELFKGFAYGIGTVVGATVGVSLLLFLLSKLSLFPIIGAFSLKAIRAIRGQ